MADRFKLTDEKIQDIVCNYYDPADVGLLHPAVEVAEDAIQAQLKKVWEEWDKSVKPLITHSSGNEGYDKEWVNDFWQALLKEVFNGSRMD